MKIDLVDYVVEKICLLFDYFEKFLMWKSLIRVFCILIGFVCLKIVIKSYLYIFEEDVKLIVIRVV